MEGERGEREMGGRGRQQTTERARRTRARLSGRNDDEGIQLEVAGIIPGTAPVAGRCQMSTSAGNTDRHDGRKKADS